MSTIYNFQKISDTLACAGQPTEEQLKQLADEQYQLIINLAPHGSNSLPDEPASVKALAMEYHNIPVVFNNPQLNELKDFIELMNQYSGNKKILVHCVANYRASAFTGLYLFSAGKLDETQMQALIEEVWQPDAVWQQFIDEGLEYLR